MLDYSKAFRRSIGGLSIFGLVATLVLLLSPTNALKELEARTWDWRLHLPGALITPDPKISLILLDQDSLEFGIKHFGVYWPWPRQMYEAVIRFMQHAGARALAFDILFTEHTAENLEDDRDFVEAVRGGPPIVMAAALSPSGNLEAREDLELFRLKQNLTAKRSGLIASLSKQISTPPSYQSAILPFKELLEATPALGNVSSAPDSDGIFRHFAPLAVMGSTQVLSLPYSLYDLTANADQIDWAPLIDSSGRTAIRFAGTTGMYRAYHISDIIQSYANISQGESPTIDPALFKDNYVLIGMTAPSLLDLRPTPLDERYSGVEINATILDNLINRNFIKKLPDWYEPLMALVSATLIILVGLGLGRARQQFPLMVLILLATISPPLIGTQFGWWIPLALPLSAAILTLTLTYAYQYQQEGRKHRFIRDAFKHYVSPGVIDRIVEYPEALSLGGERRELSLFFSDIAGFTSIAEKLPPQLLAELLNRFLSEMTSVIMQLGGTVDKYVGDAIVAFWNAPLPDPSHAEHAVQAAIICQRKLSELNDEFSVRYGANLAMRIGIHSGVVSVGNFGSHERFAYTVVGDAANLASRLEGVNKAFGTNIIISKATADALPSTIKLRPLGSIKVVGRNEPIEIFEPIDPLLISEESVASFAKFEVALNNLKVGNTKQALLLLNELKQDPVAATYIAQIQANTVLPDGTIVLKEK